MNIGDTPDIGGEGKGVEEGGGMGVLGAIVLSFSALSFQHSDLDPFELRKVSN